MNHGPTFDDHGNATGLYADYIESINSGHRQAGDAIQVNQGQFSRGGESWEVSTDGANELARQSRAATEKLSEILEQRMDRGVPLTDQKFLEAVRTMTGPSWDDSTRRSDLEAVVNREAGERGFLAPGHYLQPNSYSQASLLGERYSVNGAKVPTVGHEPKPSSSGRSAERARSLRESMGRALGRRSREVSAKPSPPTAWGSSARRLEGQSWGTSGARNQPVSGMAERMESARQQRADVRMGACAARRSPAGHCRTERVGPGGAKPGSPGLGRAVWPSTAVRLPGRMAARRVR